jgi:hypothetical protein
MPVALVGIAYAGYGGYALWAGAAGWAAVSAGMMVAGGAATLIGQASGDKDLMNTGMLVGAVGSIGYAATNAPSAAAGETTANYATSAEPVKMGAGAVPDSASLSKDLLGSNSAIAGTNVGANSDLLAVIAKSDAAMQKMATTNMIAQTGSGALQGLATYQTGQEQKKTQEEILAEQKRITERDYANRNNLTELKPLQTPTLPNLMTSARQRGLISAPSTLQAK